MSGQIAWRWKIFPRRFHSDRSSSGHFMNSLTRPIELFLIIFNQQREVSQLNFLTRSNTFENHQRGILDWFSNKTIFYSDSFCKTSWEVLECMGIMLVTPSTGLEHYYTSFLWFHQQVSAAKINAYSYRTVIIQSYQRFRYCYHFKYMGNIMTPEKGSWRASLMKGWRQRVDMASGCRRVPECVIEERRLCHL